MTFLKNKVFIRGSEVVGAFILIFLGYSNYFFDFSLPCFFIASFLLTRPFFSRRREDMTTQLYGTTGGIVKRKDSDSLTRGRIAV